MLYTQKQALFFVRIVCGLLLIYHGCELFSPSVMSPYSEWDKIKVLPFPHVVPYMGKGLELLTGISFVSGFFLKYGAAALIINMSVICFYLGSGRFWYEDQHSFMFILIGVIYFFEKK